MSGGSRLPGGRQLRNSSMLRRPGRYQEDDGPITADRPIFVHPDIPFNPNLAKHCAFPSLPLNHSGPGPSQIERDRQSVLDASAVALARKRAEEQRREEETYYDFETDDEDYIEPAAPKPTIARRYKGKQDEHDDRNWQAPSRRWHQVLAAESASHSASNPNQQGEPSKGPDTARNWPLGPQPVLPLATREPPRVVQQSPSQIPSRAARVAKISRREPVIKPLEISPDIGALISENRNTNKPLKFGKSPYPDWLDLSDAVKYAIMSELTKTMSFVRAVAQINISFDEMEDFMGLIGQEREKKHRYDKKVAKHMDDADHSWIDKLSRKADLTPITATITAREIRRGKAFLKFMGLNDQAARLGFWQGTGGNWVDINPNHRAEDGYQDLMPELQLRAGDEGQRQLEAEQRRTQRRPPLPLPAQAVMSNGELFVRMDPPPGTINPERLKRRGGLEHYPANDVPARPLPVPGRVQQHGLHPENYMVVVQSGRRFSVLDNSLWPEHEALRDLGYDADTAFLAVAARPRALKAVKYSLGAVGTGYLQVVDAPASSFLVEAARPVEPVYHSAPENTSQPESARDDDEDQLLAGSSEDELQAAF